MRTIIVLLIQLTALLNLLVNATDEDCNEPLVLPGNATLTSSTSRNPSASFGPKQALLHNTHAWCAGLSNTDQYLDIDLGLVKMIKSMAMQGNPNNDEFVKSFSVSYAVLEGQWLTYTEIGARRIFKGNSNAGEITEQVFKNIFPARYVRIKPETWYSHVCARVQIFGCEATPYRGLGMTSGDIPNSAITGSSNWDTFIAYNGRLHWTWRGAAQAWISRFNDQNQWLKIDLSAMAFVTAIATQGRHNCACNQWVTSYWFSFSTDGATFLEYKINQARKIFAGNSDKETVVRNVLSPVVRARFVRVHPKTWNVHISMRVEVYSYGRDFPADLGIEDKEVLDSQITASSQLNQHESYIGRLNYQLGTVLSWSAAANDVNQWLQFDLGHTMLVTGVVTQGRGVGYIQYIKAFKIRYSLDNAAWMWYEENSNVKVFTGNSDVTSYATNTFNREVKARSIRINPTSWHGHVSMRASVIGRRKGKLGSPVFTNQEASSYITVYKNQDVTLKCEAVGDTPITITWTHKDKVLQSKTSDTHLTLTNVTMAEEGFYKCSATNARGTNTKNLYLHMKDSFDICSQYQTLTDNTRLVTSSEPYVNDDSNLNKTMWYAFKSTKGFSRIPSKCVAQNHCGATAPGFMQGALPKVNESIVKRKVCFHNNGDCCKYSVDIYVRNCYLFYAYNLKKLDSSWKARYCTENYINENPSKMFYSSEQSLALSHHVFHRLHQVPNHYQCMVYCNMGNADCKSFNYNQALMTCELNNATANMFPHHLGMKEDYRYYDLLM